MQSLSRIARSFLSALFPGSRPEQARVPSSDPRAAGRELRQLFLSTSAESLGLRPDAEFPRVFGVAMDWAIGEQTATIAALRDGTASLYTTSTFGILGGGGHESVRQAARRFVKAAEAFHDDGVPAGEFEYPPSDSVHFFLRTYQGVHAISADVSAILAGTSPYTALFALGQEVLTELRRVSEAR